MNNNNYALLIGINDFQDPSLAKLNFAERGCNSISNIFSEEENSLFLKENILTLLGKNATTRNIKEFIHQVSFKGTDWRNTILFYYAGHGFITNQDNNSYIATYDTDVDYLNNNPDDGISMDYLYEKLIIKSKAKYVIIILDCCTSGSFLEKDDLLESHNERKNKEGYSLILSCPHGEVTFENKIYNNSILSHYLIQGLKGEAVDSIKKVITISSLVEYLKSNINDIINEKPILRNYGDSLGEIILSYSPRTRWSKIDIRNSNNLYLEPLKSILDPYADSIKILMDNLKKYESKPKIINVLEALINTFSLNSIYLITVNGEDFLIKESYYHDKDKDKDKDKDSFIINQAVALILKEKIKRRYLGYAIKNNKNSTKSPSIIINIANNEFLVINGVSTNYKTDVFCFICKKLFASIKDTNNDSFDLVEANIYDELKKTYGFVPYKILERRFYLFKNELEKCTTYFQPVIFLDPKPEFIKIASWEALARNNKGKVPEDLLKASEIWGSKFRLELDIFFLKKSTFNFYNACKQANIQDLPSLSINVYPDSLISETYYETLKQILIVDKIIPSTSVSLEISEKMPIPEENHDYQSSEYFVEILDKLVKDFHINFAIDDFGIGHSSISRLERLQLTYIKIDREISFHDLSEMTIKYVIDHVTKKFHLTGHIVLEGLDDTVPLSIQAAYEAGIRYLQGFKVGKPTPDIYNFDEENKQKIAYLVKNSKILAV